LGGKLTKAEAKVLAAAKAGEVAELSAAGIRPEEPTSKTKIRASLIRFLILGGNDRNSVHARGVLINGAWIEGKLDMEGCETHLDLKLRACWFDTAPDFDDAHLGGLYLSGCRVPGLSGQRMRLEDNLHLRRLPRRGSTPLAFLSDGTVDISSARIGGKFTCAGGRFHSANGPALICDAATFDKSVFLHRGFHSTGEVRLTEAIISGQLACTGGRFEGLGRLALNCSALTVGSSIFLRNKFHALGGVNLTRARVTGNLKISGALIEGPVTLRSAKVEEEFVWQNVAGAHAEGSLFTASDTGRALPRSIPLLDLTEATVGVLVDDAQSWEAVDQACFSGLKYESIQGDMPVSARLALFLRTQKEHAFDPSPYTQFARVLARAGHRVDADRVYFRRERLLRKAERESAWKKGKVKGRAFAVLMLAWDKLFQWLFGYGYRPAHGFGWFVGIVLIGTFLFDQVYAAGQFAPNSDVILTSDHWLGAVWMSDEFAGIGINTPPLYLWAGGNGRFTPMPPSVDYETFSPLLYSVDLFLPLDTIGQTEAWAPSKDRGWWGTIAYWVRMPIQAIGWIITAMAAASVAGLIGRKED
jgi:hypothetical protein